MRLGIDFGTCFSSAAVMIGETPTLIKDPSSLGFSVPSSVFVTPQGQVLVGKVANNQRMRDPLRYRHEFKRDLGKNKPLLLGNASFLPQELIAHVLRKIKRDADTFATNTGLRLFSGAILTVPATYPHHKRDLMLQAATQAGLVAEEVTLLEEPVAAACYYARQRSMQEGEILLVYDLGGGTFDTALLQKRGDGFDYLAPPAGIEYCGGVDFDRAIYTDLVQRHPELQGLLRPGRDDEVALLARIIVGERCVDLKHQLSEVEEAEIPIALPQVGRLIHHHLTRTAFNQMIDASIRETILCCQRMVHSTNITYEQIDRILLIGGSCRIPYVQHMIQREFARPISMASDLELVVCQGAALYAAQHQIYVVSPTSGVGDYTTIAEALEKVEPKSRIIVRPGTYQECLVLDKEIEIMGVGSQGATTIEGASGPCLEMRATTALVHGLTLRCSEPLQGEVDESRSIVRVSEGNLVLEDCAVSSTSIGVSISGPGNCTLRRCQVHTDGDEGAGVFMAEEGQATLEECEIFGTIQAGTNIEDQDVKNIGVAIEDTGSTATLHNCHIHNHDVGIAFGIDEAGQGTLEAEWCDIHHCGVSVAMGAQRSFTLSHCKIHDHTEGIVIIEQGQGAIEDCDIFGSIRSGISVKDSGSTATLRRCQIHDGQSMGIMLADEGKAEVEECTIYRNAGPGIKIQNSTATIERCNIHKGKYLGVSVSDAGKASLRECHILGNTGVGIRLSGANSKANISGCHFHGGNAVGIVIEDEGEGIIEDCHFDKNGTDVYVEPGSHFTRT